MTDGGANLDSFREHLADLSARFTRQSSRYRAPTYNEETARSEFISPFFEALGWDLANRQGNALQYRDVIHEEGIKVGDATKAPDYTFRVGGQRKFFVEAKKPGVDLKSDSAPAYQLRRYAWSAKLPLSILTDFEELAVYDTRIRPEEKDKASVARVLYFRHEEYERRAEEIWSVFSKRAVLEGRFDTYAEENLKKRGTSEVDGEFLKEIEGWREELAKNLALRNAGLTVDELNYAVQATIDRILFLRIAEGRGAELYGRLLALTNGSEIYRRLTALYREADERYNSGIFDFKADKLTLTLALDDKVIRPLLKALYYPESPYEFSVLPAEILGNVYEQFLGKVIRLTPAGRAKVEEKPEVKKAGGVYYTPSYIVDYIVENTVGKLLEGRSPKEMAKLRVVDPACGSGSFLLSAYQKLLDAHLAWYREHEPKKHKEAVFEGPGSDWRLTTAKKREVLLNSIFGVDIDRQAVEVTKLSLLLKCLEGETNESLRQLTLYGERALPSLDKNIQCGNSLISPDALLRHTGGLFPDEDELRRINPFDWQKAFPEVFKSGGFDVVIGNPPYGADYDEQGKLFFQSHFAYRKGKPETYLFFLEKGLLLLAPDGLLGFIMPNAWLTNHYGVQVRQLVFRESRILQVLDLEQTRVFPGAVVDTAALILAQGAAGPAHEVRVLHGTRDRRLTPAFSIAQRYWSRDDSLIINTQADPSQTLLLEKLERSRDTLASLVEYSQGAIPYKTSADGAANRFISGTAHGSDWRPLLESASQVRRFEIDSAKAFIRYGRWLWCARDERFFSQPKILFHRVRKKLPVQLVGALDLSGVVNRHSLSNLIQRPETSLDALWSVLALFNSRTANWWFSKRYGVLMEVGGFKVSRIPLPPRWREGSSQLTRLAQEATGSRRRLSAARTQHDRAAISRAVEATESEIDRLVYDLYELTPEEIAIVEKG
ncbi:MAG: N-6 DNA methylase [Holophagales bacterium]|nr:MAG: N-6 DNA methylase [Holophagales bacterium]